MAVGLVPLSGCIIVKLLVGETVLEIVVVPRAVETDIPVPPMIN